MSILLSKGGMCGDISSKCSLVAQSSYASKDLLTNVMNHGIGNKGYKVYNINYRLACAKSTDALRECICCLPDDSKDRILSYKINATIHQYDIIHTMSIFYQVPLISITFKVCSSEISNLSCALLVET